MVRNNGQGDFRGSAADFSVAGNLAGARKARSLSLEQLSKLSGVSKSMLRQIEIGRSSPTISVLWKIANGLRVPFTSLLARREEMPEARDFTSGATVRSGRRGYRLYPLVPFQPERPLEVYFVEIDSGVRFEGEPHQGDARETVLVMAGQVMVTVGSTASTARQDQMIRFPAGQPHRYENPGPERARLIMIIDYAL